MAIKQTEERSYDGIAPKIENITEELTVELTQDEWEDRVQAFARAQRNTESTKDRKKSVMAELNSELKIAELREDQLAGIVTSKREQREVTVEVTSDYEAGKVTKKRTDTGEVIYTRDMTTMERQGGLFDELDALPGVKDADDFIHDIHEDNKDVDTRKVTRK